MSDARPLLMVIAVSVLLFSTGCCMCGGMPPEVEMRARLKEQAESWNMGDISGYMSGYWKSEELTFSSGGETRQGWEATLQRYLTRYPDKATMGELTFEVDKLEMLGKDAAYMLGRWHLQRDEPIGGNFSLIWQKKGHLWRIVHDHTSVLADE